MIIAYIILIFYFLYLVLNIINLHGKNKIYYAIKNRKKILMSNDKYLDMNNDYDFVKYIILTEYIKYGEAIYSNSSKKAILCANIMLEKNIQKYKDFLDKEKENILNKLKESKKLLIFRIIISTIVIIASILFITNL